MLAPTVSPEGAPNRNVPTVSAQGAPNAIAATSVEELALMRLHRHLPSPAQQALQMLRDCGTTREEPSSEEPPAPPTAPSPPAPTDAIASTVSPEGAPNTNVPTVSAQGAPTVAPTVAPNAIVPTVAAGIGPGGPEDATLDPTASPSGSGTPPANEPLSPGVQAQILAVNLQVLDRMAVMEARLNEMTCQLAFLTGEIESWGQGYGYPWE